MARPTTHPAVVIITVAGAVAMAASVFGVANAVLHPDPSIRNPDDLTAMNIHLVSGRLFERADTPIPPMPHASSSSRAARRAPYGRAKTPSVNSSRCYPSRRTETRFGRRSSASSTTCTIAVLAA